MKIKQYEAINHGIDNAQYFQGCGTSFTKYDNVQTGCADTLREAIADCLEMIAQSETIDQGELDRIENEIVAGYDESSLDSPAMEIECADDWDAETCRCYLDNNNGIYPRNSNPFNMSREKIELELEDFPHAFDEDISEYTDDQLAERLFEMIEDWADIEDWREACQKLIDRYSEDSEVYHYFSIRYNLQ